MMMQQLAGLLAKPSNAKQETAMAEAMREAMQDRFNRTWRKVADDTIARLEQGET